MFVLLYHLSIWLYMTPPVDLTLSPSTTSQNSSLLIILVTFTLSVSPPSILFYKSTLYSFSNLKSSSFILTFPLQSTFILMYPHDISGLSTKSTLSIPSSSVLYLSFLSSFSIIYWHFLLSTHQPKVWSHQSLYSHGPRRTLISFRSYFWVIVHVVQITSTGPGIDSVTFLSLTVRSTMSTP